MFRGIVVGIVALTTVTAGPIGGVEGRSELVQSVGPLVVAEPVRHLDVDAREPMVVQHPDGTLFVSGYGRDVPTIEQPPRLWKSDDGGATWERVDVGTVADGAKGNSDVDLTVGGDGTVYFVTMGFDRSVSEGTHVAVGVSHDVGATWSWSYLTHDRLVDRPWIRVTPSGRVHVIWNDGSGVSHSISDDAGRTWTQRPRIHPRGGSSHIAVGPSGELAVRITPISASGKQFDEDVELIAVSTDDGMSWDKHVPPGERAWTPDLADSAVLSRWVEPLAWGADGGLFYLWSEGQTLFLGMSGDRAETWRTWAIHRDDEAMFFPYLMAGRAGELAATWFSGAGESLRVHVALIEGGTTPEEAPRLSLAPPIRQEAWVVDGDIRVRDAAGEYVPVIFLADGGLGVVTPIQNGPDGRGGFSWWRIEAGGRPQDGLRYANPLVMENAGRLADPTVIKVRGRYYLYLTGGVSPGGSFGAGVWSSDDLVTWEHHEVSIEGGRGIGAPTAAEYDGYVYLTGNDIGLFRSRDPLGPFEFFGDFVDEHGHRLESELHDYCRGCADGGVFDAAIFVDDDAKVYLYFAGGGGDGVYGVELDRADLRRLAGPVRHFFRFEPSHIWERYGSRNEMSTKSWIEGPWMTKHDGTYYLQYAAPGTEWKSYAVGVYTGVDPLGPFEYYEGNPILVHDGGLINGSGHHSVVEGPDGNLWAIYTLLYRNWNRMFERRIGMDPVGFDGNGNMFINGPSELPQWAPGVRPRPWESNGSGSIPLSEDKVYLASSEAPGRNAPYALDNSARTWWAPAPQDVERWLQVDLGAGEAQSYIVDAARILFTLPEGDVEDDSSPDHDGSAARLRRYKIEISADGEAFTTVVDRTGNDRDNAVAFDEIDPVECRYVRLTLTDWPADLPLGVLELTIFGRPVPS